MLKTRGDIGSVKTRETMHEPMSSYFPDLLTTVNFYPYVQRVVTFKSVALWTTDNLHRDSLPRVIFQILQGYTASTGFLKPNVQSKHLLQATAYLLRDGHTNTC